MVDEIVLREVDTGVQVRPIIQVDAALGMRPVAPQIEHQVSSYLRRENWPLLAFQQRERHVDSGSRSCAGGNAAIMHKQHSVTNPGSRMAPLQVCHDAPMGGTMSSIEQASFSK